MELFSELYNCYYQVVGEILKQAEDTAITRKEMENIVGEFGLEDAVLSIIPRLLDGEWKLLDEVTGGYRSKIKHSISIPLSTLQKSWLKALMLDSRIHLFFSEEQFTALEEYLMHVEALFSPDDFLYFDRYADGDPYEDPHYQQCFRMVLGAIKEHRALTFDYRSGKQKRTRHSCLPCKLEYSSKDDKFRILCLYARPKGHWRLETINMNRILKLETSDFCIPNPPDINIYLKQSLCKDPIVLCITDERNALERTMLHFATYEKRTERIEGTNQYHCSIYYDRSMETELLIQILSFGPTVRVLGPAGFLRQVKERVQRQMELFGGAGGRSITVRKGNGKPKNSKMFLQRISIPTI